MIDQNFIEQSLRADNPTTFVNGCEWGEGDPVYEELMSEWIDNAVAIAASAQLAAARSQMSAIFASLPLVSQWKYKPYRDGVEELLDKGEIATAKQGLSEIPTETKEEKQAKIDLLALFPS